MTILPHGVRSNGHETSQLGPNEAPILAVGDSYTFGDQVSDHETWPAVLEELVGRPVINGGVFAYGIDQIFLRTTQLLDIYQPDTLIFSFIAHDIFRAQLVEMMGVGKPYFDVSDDTLTLKNVPVPLPENYMIGPFRNLLSYSYFFHKFMTLVAPVYWLQGTEPLKGAHLEGAKVGCLLMRELSLLARERQLEVYVLVQETVDPTPGNLHMLDQVLACVDTRMLHLVDVRSVLAAIQQTDPQQYARYFEKTHMSTEGNAFVARIIQTAMTD